MPGDPPLLPPRDRILDDSIQPMSIPVGSWWGTRVGVSYSIFFAAAVFFGICVVGTTRPGNTDLPGVVALGAAFWIAGWLVQAVTHFSISRLIGAPLRGMTIGVVGVESSPRVWSAPRTLVITIATVISLLVLGSLFRLIEGGFRLPVLSQSSASPWVMPSMGFQAHDSIWKSGAWLCWIQALCQMYPLPRTMGRQIYAALAALCSARLDLVSQANLFRRCLLAVAIMTLALAGITIARDDPSSIPRWPLLLVLSLLLWASAHRLDVSQIMSGFQLGARQESAPRINLRETIGKRVRAWRERKRVERAIAQERSEAVDASRLDEILNRLHSHGPQSLSAVDRKILDRVSSNLRKQRQTPTDRDSI